MPVFDIVALALAVNPTVSDATLLALAAGVAVKLSRAVMVLGSSLDKDLEVSVTDLVLEVFVTDPVLSALDAVLTAVSVLVKVLVRVLTAEGERTKPCSGLKVQLRLKVVNDLLADSII